MKRIFLLLIILGYAVPQSVFAAMTISEIAWMGGVSSANHEWIEIHNDGDAVDVTGWTLTDGMNLNINLEGTISAGAYAVLERTSDESVSGTAFLIYTGALVNTGATLVLRRADNSIEDQASGGENWENVGGDNTTKETAQYASSGWLTAAPTPGRANATIPSNPEPTTTTTTKTEAGGSRLMKPSPKETVSQLIQTDAELMLKIEATAVGYVNQPVEFSVEVSGLGKTIINSLTYSWNFGDLGTSSKKSTTHIFAYPGTYMVMNEASFQKHSAIASHEITILPVAISMTRNAYGDIQINNDAKYDIDISNYQLQGKSRVTFPSNTILLSGQTITIPYAKTGGINLPVSLFDNKGVSVAKNNLALSPMRLLEEGTEEVFISPVSPPVTFFEEDRNFGFFTPATTSEPVESEARNEPISTTSTKGTKTDPKPPIWPYMALIGLIVIGIGSLILQPKAGKDS